MRELTCIVCPNGCSLNVTEGDEIKVEGNLCPRGKEFAINEIQHPMRTITSTVRTQFKEVPVLPVKISAEFPKEYIQDVMKEINTIVVKDVVKRGDVLLHNVLGLNIDIIVTSNILKEKVHE